MGYMRPRKSFGLALPSQLQVGLELQYVYSRLNFKVANFVWPANDIINIQMGLDRKKVPTPAPFSCAC